MSDGTMDMFGRLAARDLLIKLARERGWEYVILPVCPYTWHAKWAVARVLSRSVVELDGFRDMDKAGRAFWFQNPRNRAKLRAH